MAIALLPKMLEERNKLGIERYGTPLQSWNGRNPINDALEECLDSFQYLVQANIEKQDTENVMKILLRLRSATVQYFKASEELETLRYSPATGNPSWDVKMEDATGRLKKSRKDVLRAINDSESVDGLISQGE